MLQKQYLSSIMKMHLSFDYMDLINVITDPTRLEIVTESSPVYTDNL